MAQKDFSIEKAKEIANKSIKKYIVMTFVGLFLFILGIVLIAVGAAMMADNESFLGMVITGYILTFGPGIALMIVGTACWIALGTQIKVARNKIANLENKK